MHEVQLTQREIMQVIEFMRKASGNDFTDKETLVNSKMSVLCDELGYNHFYELWDAVQGLSIASAQLRERVINELTTSYSYFYREHNHFAILANLLASGDLPVEHGREMRVWSAGCASGEEAYNIAMALEDARHAGLLAEQYRVVGSDISTKAIEDATAGRYDIANVARMPPHWRNLYCTRTGNAYDVKRLLREHVEFRRENVLAPRLDAPFDAVMCRNMIIYFDERSRERFCMLLRSRVKPGGYLFLGHTEILSNLDGFTYIEPSLWRRNAADDDDLLSLLMPHLCRGR